MVSLAESAPCVIDSRDSNESDKCDYLYQGPAEHSESDQMAWYTSLWLPGVGDMTQPG